MPPSRKNTSKTTAAEKISQFSFGKLPPQAADLEEAVLGALVLDKSALNSVIDILQPSSFYKESHQIIFMAIQRLFSDSKPVDILTVTQDLRKHDELERAGGAYYISQLTNRVASGANTEYHARIIAQKFILRQLIRVSANLTKDAYNETSDVFDLLDRAEKELFDIVQGNIRKNYDKIDTIMGKAIKEIEAARILKTGITGVPSGFQELDKLTAGWQKSDLIILAARPAMGKTAFMLSLARNAAISHKKRVAIFSLEMSNIQLVNRLISSESELPAEKLKRGQLQDDEFVYMNQKITALADAEIYIDDTPALNLFELRAKARKLVQQHGVEEIIIDYLQLMQAGGDSKFSREQEVSAISRGLKSIAKELNIPVIALSQLNRSVESRGGDKKPQLSDLRECLSTETSMIYCSDGMKKNNDGDMNLLSYHEEKIMDMSSNNIPKKSNTVYRLKTASGRFIDATANHPILTSEGYKKLKDITVDDVVAIALNWENKKGKYFKESKFIGAILCTDYKNNPIPNWFIENADNKSIGELLGELIEGNGEFETIQFKEIISYSTTSLHMANQLLYLFSRIGIFVKIQEHEGPFENAHRYKILIERGADFKRLAHIMPQGAKRDRIALRYFYDKFSVENMYLDKVESITEIGERDVFDRHVPESHNFIVNGIIVHNSGAIEQDADMVIFLHRPEYYGIYEDENGRPTNGLCQVIIAKHRNGPVTYTNVHFIESLAKFIDMKELVKNPPTEPTPLHTVYSSDNWTKEKTPDNQPF